MKSACAALTKKEEKPKADPDDQYVQPILEQHLWQQLTCLVRILHVLLKINLAQWSWIVDKLLLRRNFVSDFAAG